MRRMIACLRFALVVACILFALVRQDGLLAGELTREEIAQMFSPPFVVGERDAELPVYPLFKDLGVRQELDGYVFESVDIAPVPGFSGTVPNVLVILGADGAFRDVRLVSQHEPVFVDGLGPEPLVAFLQQYSGKSLVRGVKVGAPGSATADGSVIDGVAKATASVRIINEITLSSALVVARARLGQGGKAVAPATPRADLFSPMTFAELEKAGLAVRRVITEREAEQAFAGTAGEGIDDFALANPDAVFADIRVAYLNVPSVGRNLLGDKNWARQEEKVDGGHAIFVSVGGRHAPFDERYVPGATTDRFTLVQDGFALSLRDMVYDEPLAPADAPTDPHAILKVFGGAGFDPASPWQFGIRVIREKGIIYPERTERIMNVDVALPQSWFERPQAQEEAPAGWRSIWQDRAGGVALVGVALAAVAATFIGLPATMRNGRLFNIARMAFLVVVLLVIGWHEQAQLSIVTIAGVIKAALSTGDFGFLLWDPPSLVLWGGLLISAVLWGRAFFCGWFCPFGAMQELLAAMARPLRLPQYEPPPAIDAALRKLKYVALAGFAAVVVFAPAKAEVAAEIEPFKTAITLVFERSWPAVAYAFVLLAANLFVYKAFCRYLCPLGAFVAGIGFLRRFDWIDRRAECGSPCRLCERRCRYGAIERSGRIDYAECFGCMDCVVIHEDRATCVPLVLAARRKKLLEPA